MDDEKVFEKITHLIDDGDEKPIKTIIQNLREKDEQTSKMFTVFLLERYLRHDELDKFDYWKDYTEFDVDKKDENDFNRTFLMKIIDSNGTADTIMHILNQTKHINEIDESGETPVYKIINKLEEPNTDILAYRNVLVELLKRGANPNHLHGSIIDCVNTLEMLEEFELILKHSKFDIIGVAYVSSITHNNYDFVEIILQYIEDVTVPIHNGMTPLQIAQNARNPNNDIIELVRLWGNV